MNKNIKRMFFVLTLVTLLATVGAVCAADDANTTAAVDSSVSDAATVSDSASDTVAAEPVTTTSEDNKVDTKTIEKEEKNLKKDSITIDGIEYTNIIENKEINEHIELNEKTYINNITINAYADMGLYCLETTYINNSQINAYVYNTKSLYVNNSNLTKGIFCWGEDVYIYNSCINSTFEQYNLTIYFSQGNIYLYNVTLLDSITTQTNLFIDDKCTFCEDFKIEGNGKLTSNNIQLLEKNGIYNTNKTFENTNIESNITNNANMQLINCNITSQITNNANITFINCSLSNNNLVVTSSKNDAFLLNNNANATLVNCVMENNSLNTTATSGNFYGAIYNNGTMNMVNSRFSNNSLGYAVVTGDWANGRYSGEGTVVVNNGTLNVDECNFTGNFAGNSGACISNYGLLNVDNSVFEDNTAVRHGGAISNEGGNASITNTNFTRNKVEDFLNIDGVTILGGGAIAGIDGNILIDNCVFDENLAKVDTMELAGVYSSGGAIGTNKANITVTNNKFTNNKANRGAAISLGDYVHGMFTFNYITNNTFEHNIGEVDSNVGSSIIFDNGHANIINNSFINNNNASYVIDNFIGFEQDLNVEQGATRQHNEAITQNTFTNNNVTKNTIAIIEAENVTVEDNTYTNTTINDTLTLDIPSKIYTGEPISITGTYTINNPDNYDSDILEQNKFNVYINGNLDQTVDTLEFTVTPTAGSMIITVQPTISQTRKSASIRATTLTNITITPENYNEYIYEGALIGVGQNSKISFAGDFTDKGEIYIDTSDIILDGTNATFTNGVFVLDAENIIIQNMNINNTQTTYAIYNTKDNNIITNNIVTLTNTNEETPAIKNTASNTIISNNIITLQAPAGTIDFSGGGGVAGTQAILLLGGDNNTVQNNTLTLKATSTTFYGTLEAITNSNGATNTLITQNTINISDANFNYAIDSLNNVENITITENTILVTGERYCDGIQVGNGANNIIIDNNNITCICINTTELDTEGAITYGVIATSMGSAESNNITITNNNIDITGTANYAIELYKVNNTEIHNNNITVNGPYSLGIGYAYSPNGNATGNTITIIGDSTTPINYITEEIKPENVGIRIQNGTTNVSITDNTITTSDVGGQDSTIHTEPDNVTIANNQLTSSQGYSDETIIAPETATIENNIVETTTTLAVPESIATNTPITLTATVTTTDGTPINGGTVTFTKGNEAIAQTTVTDGIATATITFTQEEEDVTIVASYTPTSTGLSTSSAEAATSIQAPVTQLNIEEIDMTAGETVTLTARVTDQNGNNLNGGKVSFKVNGKTVKDANGKVVYAKVVDGVATAQYTVPENLDGQDINITAVYTGTNKYNKETKTITTTVTAPEAKLTITPITSDVQTGSTVTLKAKVATGDKAITTGKIVFKVNGKTVKDANGKVIYAKVDSNGEVSVDYTIPESFKAGTYNIEAVFIASGYEKLTDNTTMTVVKS